jgi:eukaryotic-like serine/threonine-protein kinase
MSAHADDGDPKGRAAGRERNREGLRSQLQKALRLIIRAQTTDMKLADGSRVGAYEIRSALGAGGMGEVYRARDTKLARDVAIRILPGVFASDPERVARFEREARALATLNHPHIAQIYGVEAQNGTRALVMELVDGATLAERLARGAIPLDDALPS